ncbi:MAG TPA: SPFH domain-containing protein [Syntrophomonadaceae bacterium]|nr:SPFH domain-containing protein [Syntrophomonadaceae bacterium]
MTEKNAWKMNGFLALFLILLLVLASVFLFIQATAATVIIGVLFVLLAATVASGITIVQPNQARVIIFFGKYAGSIRESGLWATIPFSSHPIVSLRVSNFNSHTLKVNDVNGNPVEIATVVVFKVTDSARAIFDVDDYEEFVEIQSETALRHVATKYPYDDFDEGGYCLRSNAEEVSTELSRELQERLSVAGVEVLEARLTHLAYATEIANAMLQRQQAAAIVSARQKIVDGAVGMAQMAIATLEEDGVLELDEERKMAMINNLLVAIISDRGAQPILNTGSLY